jgi:hypothetical protein
MFCFSWFVDFRGEVFARLKPALKIMLFLPPNLEPVV